MKRFLALAIFIALVALVATAAGKFMPGPWYAALAKPGWTPPNWLFGPVWAVLYLMIAVAGWLVWHETPSRTARWIWVVQLGLNGLWSPVMFGAHNIGAALVIILLMWCSIAAFIIASWKTSRAAALLFCPYLAWVSYATALNFVLWRLN